jgi:hypothetical protein
MFGVFNCAKPTKRNGYLAAFSGRVDKVYQEEHPVFLILREQR